MKDLVFTIGRYKGASLSQIWESDSQYVIWFLNSIDLPKLEYKKALDEISRINKNPNNGRNKR
jgi:hypothetical protein